MVSLVQIRTALEAGEILEYQCLGNLNFYDSPALQSLATQAVAGRQLCLMAGIELDCKAQAIPVQLCEDDYPGWIATEDLDLLEVAEASYHPLVLTEAEIRARLPQVIAYTHQVMMQPNHYLWGGTVGPNYDCSGLMQTAFAVAGIWLPRDAYQQEAFVQPVQLDQLEPGDLVFFGRPDRATHVGLYLGEGYYMHSSGKDQGRNGIGIDVLSDQGDAVSQAYYRQLRGAGRVVASYIPQAHRVD
ncbi:NlpC/P60 family protein [Leptolyngbya sp. 7M]|uniref:C40 family peptidase n=1 Tax=Leptolyngbya sp. 7M TaxID=2812896 RepID=UPI001B8C2F6C|nr:NlpC/P60 family protein [Leptolyngbya sp. 7M]QYO64657.1 C40 family peptidase [Leptolyngbya sp. 7M]